MPARQGSGTGWAALELDAPPDRYRFEAHIVVPLRRMADGLKFLSFGDGDGERTQQRQCMAEQIHRKSWRRRSKAEQSLRYSASNPAGRVVAEFGHSFTCALQREYSRTAAALSSAPDTVCRKT